MYAIRNKRSEKWVYGTDFRMDPHRQRTSRERALTYDCRESVELDFQRRGCSERSYEIVAVELTEKQEEAACRICGCTWNNACVTEEGSCWWVEENLCSACVADSNDESE